MAKSGNRFISGKYSFFERKFLVEETTEIDGKKTKIIRKTKSFSEFVTLLGGLKHADIRWYSPTPAEIEKYDFEGATVGFMTRLLLKKKARRKEQEERDEKARSIIRKCLAAKPKHIPDIPNPFLPSTQAEDEYQLPDKPDFQIFYISDIHLDMKIAAPFMAQDVDSLKAKQIEKAVDKKAAELAKSYFDQLRSNRTVILIGGDTAGDPYLFGLFAKGLKRHGLPPERTFFVLGNHELRDDSYGIEDKDEYQKLVDSYREALAPYGMRLLENELYIPGYDEGRGIVLQADQIKGLSKRGATILFGACPFAVFGAMGHSRLDALNPKPIGLDGGVEANNSLNVHLADLANQLVEKLEEVLPDGRTQIVLTHTPPYFWSPNDPAAGFYFVYGHLHENMKKIYGRIRYYGDNMVGEEELPLVFKSFFIGMAIDPFANIGDGIREISPEMYSDFNSSRSIVAKARRGLQHIYLVKRGDYCAFFGRREGHSLLILNGGAVRRVQNQDLHYYFDHLTEYVRAATDLLRPFLKMRHDLSNDVKLIGGFGDEHGAIVDIDFYNHVFLNPLDGTRTCYFATSTADKYVFPNLASLLASHCPNLLPRFNHLPAIRKESWGKGGKSSSKGIRETRTDIYRYSNLIYALEYILKSKVVRVWVDEILDGRKIELANVQGLLEDLQED